LSNDVAHAYYVSNDRIDRGKDALGQLVDYVAQRKA